MLENEPRRRIIKVLHIGPDVSSKGGIASVLSEYSTNRALFESLNCEFSFAGTCGKSSADRLVKFLTAWWAIASCRISGRLDIVHIHTATRGSLVRKWILAATCMLLGQRYVVHIHSGAMERYIARQVTPIRAAVRFVWNRASRIVCLSGNMREWLTQRWKIAPAKCVLVYNGLSEPSLGNVRPATRQEPTVILFLGKLVEAKGVRTLLDAAEKLRDLGCSYRLLVGGNGGVQAFLDEVARRGLAHTVEYLGWVIGDDKVRLLANADIFVLPSHSEGFPVSIIEAMAFGVAIVSTNIPGVVDAVTHEQHGLLVPPRDDVALCDALFRLIENPAMRAKLAVAAQQRFMDRFTIKRTAEALAELYGHAINN